MAAPKYAQRIARLPQVFEELAAHPAGVPLADLAARFGVPTTELREDLLAFFTADLAGLMGLSRPSVLEFLSAEGDDEDPLDAEIVRIIDERPTEELGVEYVDASELALIYTAARALLEIDPDDEALAGAIDVLTETMTGKPLAHDGAPLGMLAPLQDAVQACKRVMISYSRSWHAGVVERTIEPYRLVQTRRGWEVDAGPPDEGGNLRTYLLSNVRSCEVLPETFEAPAELESLLERQRTTSTVRVRLPHDARWAADMYAEQAAVVADDEASVTLDLALLEPVERRVGLLLLAAGPDACVLDPSGLIASASALARELLEHHRG